jgi:hypothetical protein
MGDGNEAMDEFDVERFVFPDGTERDMIVFDQGEPGTEGTPDTTPAAHEVHVCPVCRSPLVHPTDWQRIGPASWRITLRCPNCETQRTVQLSRDEVEHFNRVLYEGTERLARQADQIARRHFQEESDKFVAALDADLILPIDF